MPDRLSPHFTLRELARTDHRKHADANLAAASEPEVRARLGALASTLLEPIRVHFGKPVVIHSGFRSPALNKAIGGSKTSQHMKGEAADFHVVGVPLREVWEWVARSALPFGQLLLEGYVGGEPSWIHLSLGAPYRDPSKCGQVMEATVDRATGKAVYRPVKVKR